MLLFFPPVVGALLGVALLGTGIATHIVILDIAGGLGVVIGGYRWLRKRNGGGISR